MMELFPQAQPLEGLLGGLLIGLAAAVMLLGAGRIAGVSGLAARMLGIAKSGTPWPMAALFVLTSVFSQFISNTATTVLVAPIAVGAAEGLGLSPYPLLMTVAIAASTAFATPVASPVNTLVLGPGGYRFLDYTRLGAPLTLLVGILCTILAPLFFKF